MRHKIIEGFVDGGLSDDEMQAACEACWAVARPWIAESRGNADPGGWSDQSAVMQTVTRAELRAAFAAVAEMRSTPSPALRSGGDRE